MELALHWMSVRIDGFGSNTETLFQKNRTFRTPVSDTLDKFGESAVNDTRTPFAGINGVGMAPVLDEALMTVAFEAVPLPPGAGIQGIANRILRREMAEAAEQLAKQTKNLSRHTSTLVDTAPVRTVGRREVTNSVANLGQGYRHIDEFAEGTAFSGVYDPKTKTLLAYPSSRNPNNLAREAVLKNGFAISENVVARNGGHSEVNEVLSRMTGHATINDRNVGFTLFSTEGGGLRVEWYSGSVNRSNPTFKGDLVPKHLRSQIARELQGMFPNRDISW